MGHSLDLVMRCRLQYGTSFETDSNQIWIRFASRCDEFDVPLCPLHSKMSGHPFLAHPAAMNPAQPSVPPPPRILSKDIRQKTVHR
jgi:hypothetical protein